ncbi:MAG: tRNA 2-thiouridine(34) synthase MnmA, partial [Acetobacteraceae bacterium]|nr:tRNA 2-thiouridine(34) synthase MnmA [Acetobacteraceae bacterium]
GDMPDKAAVRAEAARLGLAVAEKPDSQDICFVPKGRYDAVVARLRPEAAEPGEIVDRTGRVLGRHAGLARYTVGQGKGLGLARRDGEEALFVAALDAPRRRVVVAPRGALAQAAVAVGEVNWLAAPPAPGATLRCTVKLRAREAPQPASVTWNGTMAVVRLGLPAIAAPGQAAVFYGRERVLGGGFIRRAGADFVDSAWATA